MWERQSHPITDSSISLKRCPAVKKKRKRGRLGSCAESSDFLHKRSTLKSWQRWPPPVTCYDNQKQSVSYFAAVWKRVMHWLKALMWKKSTVILLLFHQHIKYHLGPFYLTLASLPVWIKKVLLVLIMLICSSHKAIKFIKK